MKITTIKASAGRTYNHPYEQYSNFRHDITIEAQVDDSDDAEAVIKDLQAHAEKLAEDHKQNLLHSIEELRQMTDLAREVADLEKSLKRGHDRIEELRKSRPEAFKTIAVGAGESEEVPYR